jgi:L-threonylcarbamoyladenylate synthase
VYATPFSFVQGRLFGKLRMTNSHRNYSVFQFYCKFLLLVSIFCIVWPMETKVIKIEDVETNSAEIKEAAEIIVAGGLVAFPTETVYGIACRVKNDSLARLDEIKGRTDDKYYSLHIAKSNDINKYVPTLRLRAQKLIQNAWPGPLTLVFELDEKDIDKQREKLEREVFENLYKDNSIGIRCPDNSFAAALLQQTDNPVVAPSANVTGQAPTINAEQVLEQLAGKIDLLLDGGPCKYQRSSTVAKIGKKGLEILRQGIFSQLELEVLSQIKFLFVCTGNTCRSPMAEGIFRKYLAEKLQCKVDELEQMGYKVSSAGIMGTAGYPASAEAIEVCSTMGIDIGAHRNRALSKELVEESDFIFAMEKMHRTNVIIIEPEAENRCVLLAGNKEIPDPVGMQLKFYENCAKLIEKAVQKRISELEI